jgi:hypothetical protein
MVNVRPEDDRRTAEALCAEIPRLRKDQAVFNDFIGLFGNRRPITAVAANLAHRKDAGLRKCFSRVRRSLRAALE